MRVERKNEPVTAWKSADRSETACSARRVGGMGQDECGNVRKGRAELHAGIRDIWP